MIPGLFNARIRCRDPVKLYYAGTRIKTPYTATRGATCLLYIIPARLLYRAIVLYAPVKLQDALYGVFMFYGYIIIRGIIARYSAFYGFM